MLTGCFQYDTIFTLFTLFTLFSSYIIGQYYYWSLFFSINFLFLLTGLCSFDVINDSFFGMKTKTFLCCVFIPSNLFLFDHLEYDVYAFANVSVFALFQSLCELFLGMKKLARVTKHAMIKDDYCVPGNFVLLLTEPHLFLFFFHNILVFQEVKEGTVVVVARTTKFTHAIF